MSWTTDRQTAHIHAYIFRQLATSGQLGLAGFVSPAARLFRTVADPSAVLARIEGKGKEVVVDPDPLKDPGAWMEKIDAEAADDLLDELIAANCQPLLYSRG